MYGIGLRAGIPGPQRLVLHGRLHSLAVFSAMIFLSVCGHAQNIDISPEIPAPIGAPPVSPSVFPWTALGRLVSKAGFCGAVLIGEDRALTASHCLRDHGAWLAPNQLKFLAGFSNGKFQLESNVENYVAADWNYRKATKDLGDWRDDWALLKLATPLGKSMGTLSLAAMRERTVLAYGKDLFRFYHGSFGTYETPQFAVQAACNLMRIYGAVGVFLSDCESRPGDSGSPLLMQRGAEFVLAGIYLGKAGNTERVYTVLVTSEEILREMPRVELQLSPAENGGYAAAPSPQRPEKNPLDPTRWTPSKIWGGS